MPRKLEVRRGFLDASQLERFLEAESRSEYRLLWLLMCDCGLRMGECLRLQWGDLLDDGHGREQLRIEGKGRRLRYVPTTKRVRDAAEAGFLFAGPGAETAIPFVVTSRAVQQRFKRVAARAGVLRAHLCPHSLRHTYATRLLIAGVDPLSVSAMLGHRSMETTLGYLHTNPEAQRRVAQALENAQEGAG